MSDERAITNLFEDCYAESVERMKEETRVDSPFPPFNPLEYPSVWKLYQDLRDGNQWTLMPKMAKWKSRPQKNICFVVTQGMMTLLTDNRPSIAILPRSPEDSEIAELVQAGVDYWMDEQDFDRKVMDVVNYTRTFGVGWMHLVWDREKKQHVLKSLPPWAVKVDPDTTADNYDPSYLIYEFKTTVGELMEKFPSKDFTNFDPAYQPTDAKLFQDTMYDSNRPRAFQRNGVIGPSTPTWCYQFWIRDGEADYIDRDLPSGKVAVVKKKKYPKGRVITIAGGIVLDDKPSPYNHGQFPFVPYFAYRMPGKFYGPGDIQNIMSIQVYRNRTMQQLYDSIEKSMGAMILVNNRLFKGDRITNEPVQVHEVADINNAVKVERMGNLTRHETTLLSVFDKDGDDVAGQHEFSRGETVPGNKTAEEVSIIAASDQTRVRAAARDLAWSNRMLAKQLLSNMAQWTDYEWVVRIAGETGEETLPVTFNGSMMKRENSRGKLTEESITFDIRVDDYSTLPASQRDKSGLYMQLFGMVPNFPVEEFLKGLGLPNYKAIAMKIDEQQQAQMQAQAQVQAQSPQPMEGGMPPEMGVEMSAAPPMEAALPEGMTPEMLAMLLQMQEQLGGPAMTL